MIIVFQNKISSSSSYSFCLFVCIEVLTAQSTKWGHVECGQFTWPHCYWADLVLYAVNQYCAHYFARNWQLPFLNQRKGENDRRKYFMIKCPRKNVADLAGVEPATTWYQSDAHPTVVVVVVVVESSLRSCYNIWQTVKRP